MFINLYMTMFIITYLLSFTSKCVSSQNNPRHIVFALLDDIGWSDLSSTGGRFPTPFIDNLRSQSIILDRHYVHLLCSTSRSQFLTGRRASNLGFGSLHPFGYTQITGIPIGQPTIANWLRDFPATNPSVPTYKTYGIGKWHLGYASSVLTPEHKGFEHFYGFYQSGIDYVTKDHPKGVYWGSPGNQFDFFEDENPAYGALNTTENTMDLYMDKIEQYLTDFDDEQQSSADELNMYLYLGVQTLHGPLTIIRDYTQSCNDIFGNETATNQRFRVCEYTMMTDAWMEGLVTKLQSHGLWDDTLLIFTGDNGADIDVGACNYPLRGTKSTMFEGNIRQITFVSGGVNVIPTTEYGTVRTSLSSNLDWTPTLLSYANILPFIDEEDYTWDGYDIWDMILSSDDVGSYDHLLLNIESETISDPNNLESASILFKYEWFTNKGKLRGDGHLYKYVAADISKKGVDENWVKKRNDGWCLSHSTTNAKSVLSVADSPWSISATIKDSQFLFDLTDDEGEKYNLMRKTRIDGSSLRNKELNKITDFAKKLLKNEVNINTPNNRDLYHKPIDCLYTYQVDGDPINFFQRKPVRGYYILPFYNRAQYLQKTRQCLDSVDNSSVPTTRKFRNLYLMDWVVPNALIKEEEEEFIEYVEVEHNELRTNDDNGNVILYVVMIVIGGLLALYKLVFCDNVIKNKLLMMNDVNDNTPLLSSTKV